MAANPNVTRWAPIVRQAAAQYRLPASLLLADINQESGGNPNAVSPAGAFGLTQFIPSTASEYGVMRGSSPAAVRSQIFGQAKYLAGLGAARNPAAALAGYYTGTVGSPAGASYARSVLAQAADYAAYDHGLPAGTPAMPTGSLGGGPSSVSFQMPTLNQPAFQQANRATILGNFLRQSAQTEKSLFGFGGSGGALGPLFAAGKLRTGTMPNPMDYMQMKTYQVAQSSLQRMAGGTTLMAHPQVGGGKIVAGGFLPQGAVYTAERQDQGRDGITNPGGPVIANGNGYVVRVGSDPSGFGPSYPIVHFTSGPYAGRTLYFGHTLATVRQGQQVRAGQVLGRTGTHGVGNATVPGWFEIGYADSGSPGAFGQPAPF